jgi:hypothetical protein
MPGCRYGRANAAISGIASANAGLNDCRKYNVTAVLLKPKLFESHVRQGERG